MCTTTSLPSTTVAATATAASTTTSAVTTTAAPTTTAAVTTTVAPATTTAAVTTTEALNTTVPVTATAAPSTTGLVTTTEAPTTSVAATTTAAAAPQTTKSNPGTRTFSFYFIITMEMKYEDGYSNRNSDIFINFRKRINPLVLDLLRISLPACISVDIETLIEGSVIGNFSAQFPSDNYTNKVVQSAFDEGAMANHNRVGNITVKSNYTTTVGRLFNMLQWWR